MCECGSRGWGRLKSRPHGYLTLTSHLGHVLLRAVVNEPARCSEGQSCEAKSAVEVATRGQSDLRLAQTGVVGVIAVNLCHFGVVQKGRMGYDDCAALWKRMASTRSVILCFPGRRLDCVYGRRWDGSQGPEAKRTDDWMSGPGRRAEAGCPTR
jgi:hypothetical protein